VETVVIKTVVRICKIELRRTKELGLKAFLMAMR